MRKTLLSTLAVFLMLCFAALAQEKTVTGRVISGDDNSPLPGVAVVVKGTTAGGVTDIDGKYKIIVPAGGTHLVFSFVGYQTQEVAIGSNTTIDVVLKADVKQLEEVVVTAIGIEKEKKALGFAVTTVNETLIRDKPEADVGRVLQGKVPGVNITSTGGVSGTGTNIIIRGYSSITGSNQPLFVVDGVPFNSNTNSQSGFTTGGQTTSSRFLDLDPNNIANVTVLKGLSATVLYGDQGRNGVILITTKAGSGKRKTAEINLTQSVFANRIASAPVYQNNYGAGFDMVYGPFFSNWGPHFNTIDSVVHPYANTPLSLRSEFPAGTFGRVAYEAKLDPIKAFFRTGITSNTSLEIAGSSNKTNYSATFGYTKEEGFTPGNTLEKLNFGLGVNSAITEKMNIKSSFMYAITKMETPPLNAGYGSNPDGGIPSIFANVFYTPRSVDLANWPYETPITKRSIYYRGSNDIVNPKWSAKYYKNTSDVQRFFNSTSLSYDILPNLVATYRLGLDTYREVQEIRLNKGGPSPNQAVLNGCYQTVNITNSIWNNDLILQYNKELASKFNISALVGFNSRYDIYHQDGIASQNQLAFNLFRHTNFVESAPRHLFRGTSLNFMEEQRRVGIYTQATIDYGGFVFLNLTGRNDWTSTVEKANRQIFYPGASVSFIPTDAFDIKSDMLNYLKVRAGVGTSAGFPSPYSTRSFLSQNSRRFVNSTGTAFTSHTIDNRLGNPNLKPELHQEYEFGLEGTFLRNRLKADISLYTKDTRNLITDAFLDPSTGYTVTAVNVGKINNKGIEASLTGEVLKINDFEWSATFNFNRYVTTVKQLAEGFDEIVIAGFTNLGNFAIPGKPFNVIKGSRFLRNEKGERIVAANGNYIETNDIQILGDPNPKFTSSLINNFSFKGITLSIMWEYRHRGVIYATTAQALLARGVTKDTDFIRELPMILPGVKQNGQPNDIIVTASDYTFSNYFTIDEAAVFDGTTIRLREMSLSYELPKNIMQKTPFQRASIAFSGTNLRFRAVNMPRYVNFDTDVLSLGVGNGLGFDYLTGPSARRYGGTLKLTF